MRRFLTWYLPLLAAIIGAAVFAAGFYAYLTGRLGTVVGEPAGPVSGQPPRGIVVPVILGDSLARGTGDETGLGIGGRLTPELKKRRIQSKPAINLAVNGARTADLLQELDSRNVRTVIAESNVVIISIGANDLWGGTDWRNAPPRDPDAAMAVVLERIDRVLHIIREANPKARVFLVGLYNPFAASPFGPMLTALVNRWNGKLLERFGGDANLTIVPTSDLFSHHDRLSLDRFHPGDEGYQLIAERIAESM